MPSLTMRAFRETDLDWLAAMNLALIKDAGGRSGLTPEGFAARFRRRAADGYRIFLFERDGQRIGFASHQARVTDDGLPYTHLAQFHIAREHRRRGLGRQAYALLQASWPAQGRVTLDVLCTNAVGRRFWEGLGFSPFSTAMEIMPPEPAA